MRLYSIEIRNPNPKWSFDWGAHAPGAWPLHPQSAIPYPFPVLTLDASRLHWPVKCEAYFTGLLSLSPCTSIRTTSLKP